jgi:hypothetical protein
MKAQQASRDVEDTEVETRKLPKRRPRKRYFNGYGKVPGTVEAVTKDPEAKTSRAFSGKAWNRGSSRGVNSLSSRSGLLRKDPTAPTQTHPIKPYQFAFNYSNAEAQSNFLSSSRTPLKVGEGEQQTVTS